MIMGLVGCKSKSVKEVEKQISSIGVVNEDSGELIESAENAFMALSADEQNKVSNYNTLVMAKNTYADLPVKLTLDNYEKYIKISYQC